jgi:hypothetical protein
MNPEIKTILEKSQITKGGFGWLSCFSMIT